MTQSSRKVGKEFHPRRAKKEMENLRSRWHQALGRAKAWNEPEGKLIRRDCSAREAICMRRGVLCQPDIGALRWLAKSGFLSNWLLTGTATCDYGRHRVSETLDKAELGETPSEIKRADFTSRGAL